MRKSLQRLALAIAVFAALATSPFSARAADDQEEVFSFHSPVPLGIDAIQLEHVKKTVYLLASVENQSLEGVHVTRAPHHGHVERVDGTPVKTFPDSLDFRVTASAMEEDINGVDRWPIRTKQSVNDFLLGLHFKLKVFRGMHMVISKPVSVKLIGVPAYEPYNERVYRVVFDTPNIPVDARLVLEVYAADGQRLTRFHLEML